MAVPRKKTKAAPTFSKAEVDALNARIEELTRSLDNAVKANEGLAKEHENADVLIDDLNSQLANREEANQTTVEALKLSTFNLTNASERIVELDTLYKKSLEVNEKLTAQNKELVEAHGRVKADAVKMVTTRDRLEEIVVPAMVNKARAVRACRSIEENDSCSNVHGIVARLRLFIEDHCK